MWTISTPTQNVVQFIRKHARWTPTNPERPMLVIESKRYFGNNEKKKKNGKNERSQSFHVLSYRLKNSSTKIIIVCFFARSTMFNFSISVDIFPFIDQRIEKFDKALYMGIIDIGCIDFIMTKKRARKKVLVYNELQLSKVCLFYHNISFTYFRLWTSVARTFNVTASIIWKFNFMWWLMWEYRSLKI